MNLLLFTNTSNNVTRYVKTPEARHRQQLDVQLGEDGGGGGGGRGGGMTTVGGGTTTKGLPKVVKL